MKRLFATALGAVIVAVAARGQNARSPTDLNLVQQAKWNGGVVFLTRLRIADPDYRLILMACLKEHELNLLLSRFVTPEEIPILVKGLLVQLSHQFPGEDLSVVAFRPVVPLREAALARLNLPKFEDLNTLSRECYPRRVLVPVRETRVAPP